MLSLFKEAFAQYFLIHGLTEAVGSRLYMFMCTQRFKEMETKVLMCPILILLLFYEAISHNRAQQSLHDIFLMPVYQVQHFCIAES